MYLLIIISYAPWCGHCKSLTAVWEELALVENPAGRVRVGKVDCSRFIGIKCPLPQFFLSFFFYTLTPCFLFSNSKNFVPSTK